MTLSLHVKAKLLALKIKKLKIAVMAAVVKDCLWLTVTFDVIFKRKYNLMQSLKYLPASYIIAFLFYYKKMYVTDLVPVSLDIQM